MNDELRAALDKLDAALAEARAAMEPEPPCDCRWEYDQDGGSFVCQDCGAVHPGNEYPPATIRAACAEKGVPCVAEKSPRGVVVQSGGRDIRLATIDEIGAGVCPGAGPRLYVKLGSCLSWTTTPIADIIAQAAVPNIELPNVTVKCSGWTWTRIDMVTVEARSNDTLDTTIVGVSDSGTGKEFPLSSARTTPAQVVQLCELAGWPKPEVRCEFHHCDGTACEVDPARVTSVRTFRTTATRETRVWMGDDDWLVVREPVPVVQRMIDACREGE